MLHIDIYSLFKGIVMLEKSLGLHFFLRKPQNYKDGIMDVYLRITVDGIPKELSVKRTCEKSKWDGKKNRAIGNKEDARSLNEFIDVLQNKAYQARKHLNNQMIRFAAA